MKNIFLLTILLSTFCFSQTTIKGVITSKEEPLAFASVYIPKLNIGSNTDENGNYILKDIPQGEYIIHFSFIGFKTQKKNIILYNETQLTININLDESQNLNEVVVTGTLKAVSRLETPVPVEVYTATFLKKNPTPNIFEALQNVNGVRPQLNCNICNTGDIHINGLEGPYTMVTIDGMPIVSGLSTVYGLSGIPNSLIDRIEIVKGPASSLYGSEAVGGLINIITKSSETAPLFYADIFSTSWFENNIDLGGKYNIGKSVQSLLGVNYFNYSNPIDNNHDNFTDVTLQDRISVFNKFTFNRTSEKEFSLASRFFYEDRWGGEMQWNKNYRGGSDIYGESIYTKRYELIGKYQLPISENVYASFSYTNHNQNSVYGNILFLAQQEITYGQLTWDKKIKNHDLLFGAAFRYQYYNDNTTATIESEKSKISSFFVQDEIKLAEKHSILLGSRYDYNSIHGAIFTPRIAYKWKPSKSDIFRINTGTGFRVVNLFTEEHAALTGSRDVIITENLNPEKSYNINLNYLKKFEFENGIHSVIEFSSWYTHFKNQIIPDYDTNPNQIIYSNLNGYSKTYGLTGNIELIFPFGLKTMVGFTALESKNKRNGILSTPILTEKFSTTWGITYDISKWNLSIDYTGNLYGPMRLPLLGDLDPRSEYSPVWSIQNIQFTYKKLKYFELYGGIKNLLNWTPNKNNPFLIARANDPFDNDIVFDANGNAVPTENNPYALTFDPSYVYAPNQGIRGFLGLRYIFN
ncbi:TonB-dependent receptor [Flavobacterium sediminilitoris]|uniref:TonB-dependent receptor n=1 Tax=Flavobacterium sediminilitoris TaxID=2024526 RepID=A0ABY4HQT3_9FLAO|nr:MULTISPECIES: TonB-dependent receptor [Flavobacterium]UOX34986.1 TonB-dependent receptor [Flavobacterium sediminilitoris]